TTIGKAYIGQDILLSRLYRLMFHLEVPLDPIAIYLTPRNSDYEVPLITVLLDSCQCFADYVPALCTHRPSLLPIEWLSEAFGLAQGGWQRPPRAGKLVKLGHLEEVKVVTRFP
ncbi:hypothetical protein T310_10178, partial [Rasamsonia emersonii CBS 393.64]